MSELKAFESGRIYWAVEQVERVAGDIDRLHLDDNWFYIKSEADKVIAEKDAGIEKLKAIRKVHVEAIASMEAGLHQDEKKLRRHKYKRCLAMAKWCRIHDEFTQLESERLGLQQRTLFFEYRKKAMWWNKWHKRWLKIAKKFKEAK